MLLKKNWRALLRLLSGERREEARAPLAVRPPVSTPLHPSASCRGKVRRFAGASSTRRTSCGLRPTERSVTYTKRTMPSGSTMKVARWGDALILVENAERARELAPHIGQHRKGQILQIGYDSAARRDARIPYPSRRHKAPCRDPGTRRSVCRRRAISVGHTKVKSFGQKKKTFHLPASSLDWKALKAVFGSVETTPCSAYPGNFSPTLNILQHSKRASTGRRDGGFRAALRPAVETAHYNYSN